VGRFLQRFEDNEPVFTIGSRTAGQRDRQRNAERWNFPPLARAARLHRNARRIEQVVPRRVLPVIVLDSVEHGELVPRSHVDLESSDAVHDVVVDALGEAAVSFSTRLPIAFQDGGRIMGKGCELWRGRTSNQREAAQQRTDVATRTVSEGINGRVTPKRLD
jgi:hypothetical protein